MLLDSDLVTDGLRRADQVQTDGELRKHERAGKQNLERGKLRVSWCRAHYQHQDYTTPRSRQQTLHTFRLLSILSGQQQKSP